MKTKSWLVQDCSRWIFQVQLPGVAQWTTAKNCRKLVFCVFPEQLLSHIMFGWLHCYEVTLVNDKVIWKRSRDLITRRFNNVTPRRGEDVPQRCHWGFHLGLTGVVRCFIWGLFQTSWRRIDGTSLLRFLETSSRHSNKTWRRRTTETSWRRSIETSMGVSFETFLWRHWDVQRDVVTTLPQCLVARWDLILYYVQKYKPFKFYGIPPSGVYVSLNLLFFTFSRFFSILEEFL